MKLIRLLSVVSVVALGAMGATAYSAPKPQDKVPAVSAKPKVTKVRWTYRQCRVDALAMCQAQHPGDNGAAIQCWNDYIDAVCAGLPGAP